MSSLFRPFRPCGTRCVELLRGNAGQGVPRLSRTWAWKPKEDGRPPVRKTEIPCMYIDQVSGIEFTVLDDREYSYCLVESWRKDINYGMTALEISSQKIEIFNQFRCFTGFPMGNDPVFISRCDSWSTFLLLFPYGITAQGTKHGRSYGHVQPFRTLLRRRLLLSRQYAVSVSGSMPQGSGRQHGGCLPSARQVPGPGTSAGKPRLSLPLPYTARRRWLALAIDYQKG